MVQLRSLPSTQSRLLAMLSVVVLALVAGLSGGHITHAAANIFPCTSDGVIAAASTSGTATFDCSGPTTIQAPMLSPVDGVVLDGGGKLTLDGQGNHLLLLVLSGTVTVKNMAFINGAESDGVGGAMYNSGTLYIINSTISNSVAGLGGAIANQGTVYVSGSTFQGNHARYGGAIHNYRYTSTVFISNSTFVGNSAESSGGAIDNDGSEGTPILTITNSTFVGNTATSGGGAVASHGQPATVSNSIFSNNSDASCQGNIVDGGHNLVNNDVSCGFNNNVVNADPKLSALANNGGPTQTMALQADSPAIDAGDDTICAADPVNNKDQRGAARPAGTHCDIGAYEANASLITLSAPKTATYGSTVAVTATVTSDTTPTGTVTFTVDGTAQTPVGLTGGSATFSSSTLTVGDHTVSAVYSGDSTVAGSSSEQITLTITKIATTLTLTPSKSISQVGDTVTFTATVTADSGTPTGTVTFSVDNTDQSPVDLVNGSTTFSTSTLSLGLHTISAAFTSDTFVDSEATANATVYAAGTYVGMRVALLSNSGNVSTGLGIHNASGAALPGGPKGTKIAINFKGVPIDVKATKEDASSITNGTWVTLTATHAVIALTQDLANGQDVVIGMKLHLLANQHIDLRKLAIKATLAAKIGKKTKVFSSSSITDGYYGTSNGFFIVTGPTTAAQAKTKPIIFKANYFANNEPLTVVLSSAADFKVVPAKADARGNVVIISTKPVNLNKIYSVTVTGQWSGTTATGSFSPK